MVVLLTGDGGFKPRHMPSIQFRPMTEILMANDQIMKIKRDNHEVIETLESYIGDAVRQIGGGGLGLPGAEKAVHLLAGFKK